MERHSFPSEHLTLLRSALLIYLCIYTFKPVHSRINVVKSSGPEVTVNVGDNVTLECHLSNVGNEDIYWYTDTLGDISRNDVIIEANLPGGHNHSYSILGNQSAGEFNLYIGNVHMSDAKTYKCVHYTATIGDTRLGKIVLITTKLTVHNLPSDDSPICKVLPRTGTNFDFIPDEIFFQCDTTGGDPIPALFWYRSGNELLDEGSGNLSTPYTLSSDDSHIVFTCSMKTPALDDPRNCSVTPLQIPVTTTILATNSVGASIPMITTDIAESRTNTEVTVQHMATDGTINFTLFTDTGKIIISLFAVVTAFLIVCVLGLIWYLHRRKTIAKKKTGNSQHSLGNVEADGYTEYKGKEDEPYQIPLKKASIPSDQAEDHTYQDISEDKKDSDVQYANSSVTDVRNKRRKKGNQTPTLFKDKTDANYVNTLERHQANPISAQVVGSTDHAADNENTYVETSFN